MDEELNFSEGYSLNYLIPASFSIGAGLLMLNYSFIIALLFIFFGIILLLVKTGVAFTPDLKTVKNYKSFFGYKIGTDFKVSDFHSVKLKYTNEASLMQSRGSSNVIRARTYDIVLTSNSQRCQLLHEFTDYKLALKTFNVFLELGYGGTNLISETQKATVKNRIRNRRR